MNIRLRGEWAIVWVITVCAAVAGAQSVYSASEPSVWLQNGAVKKSLVADNMSLTDQIVNPDCLSQKLPILDKVSSSGELSYSEVYDSCWLATSSGAYRSNGIGYLHLNVVGSAVRLADPYYAYTLAGDRVLKRGGGSTSFFYNLRVIENPADAAVVANGNGGYRYLSFGAKTDIWLLTDPGTTTAMPINAHYASRNGKWLLVESPWSFARINLDTRQVLAFEKPISGYGAGANPQYQLTLSEDGRYAAIGLGAQLFNLYDLSLCQSTTTSGRQIAVGCGKRVMRDELGLDSSSNVVGIRFGALGDILTFNSLENGKWRKYSVVAPGKTANGLSYLALGDSYSSGEGDGDGKYYYMPGTDGNGEYVVLFQTGISGYPYSREKCHLSTRSYPYLLAASAGLGVDSFRSVACSGADVNDVTNTKSDINKEERLNGHFDNLKPFEASQVSNVKYQAVMNYVPGRAAQIEFITRYKPKNVTISLGGNDVGFGNKLSECVMVGTCRYALADRYEIVNEMKNTVYPRLVSMYRSFKQASPTTRVYAIGYPQLIGQSRCNANVQLDNDERRYVRESVSLLNQVVRGATAEAGVNYIDIEHSLDGVNLCSDQKYPALNGLTYGQEMIVIGSESYHPNESGHALIAATIKNRMNNQSIATYQPCASSIVLHCNTSTSGFPSQLSSYFSSAQNIENAIVRRQQIIQNTTDNMTSVADVGGTIRVTLPRNSFKENSSVGVTVKSDPMMLPAIQSADDGSIDATFVVPLDLPSGYHTIHLLGALKSGEMIDYYDTFLAAYRQDDIDGDGVNNSVDRCQFVTPLHEDEDEDKDTLDDACDGFVGVAPIVTPPNLPDPDDPSNTSAGLEIVQPQQGAITLPGIATNLTSLVTRDVLGAAVDTVTQEAIDVVSEVSKKIVLKSGITTSIVPSIDSPSKPQSYDDLWSHPGVALLGVLLGVIYIGMRFRSK